VLVLGATSGIGRSLARQYAERGARVCVVGRRERLVREVEAECRDARLFVGDEEDGVLAVQADFTSAEDMINVRNILQQSMLICGFVCSYLTLCRMARLGYFTGRCGCLCFTTSLGRGWR
jgi:NAD(P)-dependent dehydrogenase (short-subunit alcohol dehydrogenase family)